MNIYNVEVKKRSWSADTEVLAIGARTAMSAIDEAKVYMRKAGFRDIEVINVNRVSTLHRCQR